MLKEKYLAALTVCNHSSRSLFYKNMKIGTNVIYGMLIHNKLGKKYRLLNFKMAAMEIITYNISACSTHTITILVGTLTFSGSGNLCMQPYITS